MKQLRERILLSLLVLISICGYVTSCTHENEVLPPPSTSTPDIKRGDGVFLPGNMTVGDTSSWKFDQAHSSVLWSANYLGALISLQEGLTNLVSAAFPRHKKNNTRLQVSH
jgi:hypothetical protein